MNESEDFYEDFDVNQTDYEYAMNPGKYRRQTKEKQLYGVFAASSDEDDNDNENDSKAGFSGRNKKKADYTAPVSFISGGIKHGNTVDESNVERREEDEEEPQPPKKRISRDEHAGLGFSGVGGQVFAGMRGAATGNNAGGTNSTSWASSKVMGMMKGMGYVPGKGLGANKQGIVEPVQAFLRPGRGAIGAYGKEKKGPKYGESAADAQNRLAAGSGDENDIVEVTHKQGNWKKINASRKQKVRYRTLDDVVNENEEAGGRMTSVSVKTATGMGGVKIIDMTGPEQKVYNDFGSFTRRARAPDVADGDRTKFNIPELMSNLNMLIDLTEEEIRKSDQQLRFIKDQTEVLYAEQKRLRAEANEQKLEISHMHEVANIVDEFQRLMTHRPPTLAECRALFLRLSDEYPVEYKLYGLDGLARASVLPVLKEYFLRWDPLDPEQVRYGFDALIEWRDILRDGGNGTSRNGGGMFEHFRNDTAGMSVFDYCVWEGWMPSVRRAALTWSPRDNGPAMIALVEQWLSLLPPWIAENLLDQIIVPRIKSQVDEWDPRLDAVPIDSWLLPWRFIMGDRLLLVYSIIRQKLKKGLENWRPGDRSAIESIRPWKDVFSTGTMHSFLGMSIVPKLELALQTIDINTIDQFQYLELNEWLELINVDVIRQIFVKNFFPRFHLCMESILSAQHAEEYYLMWKNAVPEVIKNSQIIRNEFTRAILMLRQIRMKQAQTQQMGGIPMGMAPPPPSLPFSSVPMPAVPQGFPLRPPPPPPPPHGSSNGVFLPNGGPGPSGMMGNFFAR